MKKEKKSKSEQERDDLEMMRFGARLWLQRLMAWVRTSKDGDKPPDELFE